MIALLEITEGSQASGGAKVEYEIDLNNGGWVLIAMLICIIIVIVILLFVMWYRDNIKINKLQEQIKKGITSEETTLLLKYGTLNDRDKAIIQDTIETLVKNSEHKKE